MSPGYASHNVTLCGIMRRKIPSVVAADSDEMLGSEETDVKTMAVDDGLYTALEAAADRNGRPVQELVNEAIASWLMDEADHAAIKQARAEAAEQGGVEFEAFFDGSRGGASTRIVTCDQWE